MGWLQREQSDVEMSLGVVFGSPSLGEWAEVFCAFLTSRELKNSTMANYLCACTHGLKRCHPSLDGTRARCRSGIINTHTYIAATEESASLEASDQLVKCVRARLHLPPHACV